MANIFRLARRSKVNRKKVMLEGRYKRPFRKRTFALGKSRRPYGYKEF